MTIRLSILLSAEKDEGERTDDLELALVLDHFDVVRDEVDLILDLKTRVARLLEDQATIPALHDLGLDVGDRCVHGDVGEAG